MPARRRIWTMPLALLIGAAAVLVPAAPASAATLTVTTTADVVDAGACATLQSGMLPGEDGLVSLREAVCAANASPGSDTITFAVNGTFALTGAANEDLAATGDLDVRDALTILGNGSANTVISGSSSDRVFEVVGGVPFTLDAVTITNGNVRAAGYRGGGGLRVGAGSSATLTSVAFLTNLADFGGAIDNSGQVGILRSTFTTNQGFGPTGANYRGGAIYNEGALSVSDTTFASNIVRGEGGGIWTSTGGGRTVQVTGSTFFNNQATAIGGGAGIGAGVLATGTGDFTIDNSTFHGNAAATRGGAMYITAPEGLTGSGTITQVTVADNQASTGGGIAVENTTLTIGNSIIARNVGFVDDSNLSGTADVHYSLVGDPGGNGVVNNVDGNRTGTLAAPLNPQLGGLVLDGGLTQTRAVLATSPAFNAGSADYCGATDQRGVARPQGSACDMGAYELVVDSTPPQTTLTRAPDPITPATSASFVFTGSDNIAVTSFQCSLDRAPFTTCSTGVTYSGLADGLHTFQVRAVDGAGNVDASPEYYTWIVDSVPPTSAITLAPDNPTSSTSARIEFTADGTGTGVSTRCTVDGGAPRTCTSPLTLTGLTDGSHTVTVIATDGALSVQAVPASVTWIVDTVSPDTTISSAPDDPSAVATATFEFSGSDGGGIDTFECSIDGSAFAACATPFDTGSLADGPHTFQVRAVDPAGNRDASPAQHDWVIDTVAPTVALTAAPSSSTSSTSAVFRFSGAGGVDRFECSVDGGAFAACTSPVRLTNLAQGGHTFEVRAVDAAGNVSTVARAGWLVTPPADRDDVLALTGSGSAGTVVLAIALLGAGVALAGGVRLRRRRGVSAG